MGAKEVRWAFDVMHRDDVCTHVKVMSDLSIEFENFTDDIVTTAFGNAKEADITMLEDFFRDRCFEEGRPDKDRILKYFGLNEYDPFGIVRVTHGALVDDFTWIRFDGETLTWEDICRKWRSGVFNK